MKWLYSIFKWIFRALEIFAPIAPLLWGVSIYSGIAYSVWVIIHSTADLIVEFGQVFESWAQGWDTLLVQMFQAVSGNSFFSFFAYITSLDVPLEWFRYSSAAFIRYGLTYTCGISIAVLEVCIVVLGIYFLRSRIKSVVGGLGGGSDPNGGGGNV